jgi:hypothetical protein
MSLRALRPCESILYFSKKTVISQGRSARRGYEGIDQLLNVGPNLVDYLDHRYLKSKARSTCGITWPTEGDGK